MNKEDIKQLKGAIEEVIEPHFAVIQQEFHKIDKRFEVMDERFDRMDERFDRMDASHNNLANKVDSLEWRIIAIEDILTDHRKISRRHEQELRAIKQILQEMQHGEKRENARLAALEKRTVRLEEKILIK